MDEQESSVNALKRDMRDVKAALDKVADALTRLTVLEERHASTQVLQARMVDRLEAIEAASQKREIEQARTHDIPSRVVALEVGFRELHVEREAEKSSMRAYRNSARVIWTVIGFIATSGWGMAIWQFLMTRPTP